MATMNHSVLLMDFRASFDGNDPFIGPYTENIGTVIFDTTKGESMEIHIFATEEVKSLLDDKTYTLRLFDDMIDDTMPIVVELSNISEDEFLLLKLSWR